MVMEGNTAKRSAFCRWYLRTLDPERAAAQAGVRDGWSLLQEEPVRQELARDRECLREQILREDAVRRLAELAFGRVNDAAALALAEPGKRPPVEKLDLSAVSELKVTDKGVEIKFLDRVRALETLCELLRDPGSDASAFFQALEGIGAEEEEP